MYIIYKSIIITVYINIRWIWEWYNIWNTNAKQITKEYFAIFEISMYISTSMLKYYWNEKLESWICDIKNKFYNCREVLQQWIICLQPFKILWGNIIFWILSETIYPDSKEKDKTCLTVGKYFPLITVF